MSLFPLPCHSHAKMSGLHPLGDPKCQKALYRSEPPQPSISMLLTRRSSNNEKLGDLKKYVAACGHGQK